MCLRRMTFREARRYLESFVNYEKVIVWPYKESLKLERFRDFLSTIGDPQTNRACIHVAGSKGKGSTCAFIASILQAAGFKTGLYTSPHLSDLRERIRVLVPGKANTGTATGAFAGMIPKRSLALLVQKLKPAIERYNKTSVYGPLSFFEVYTALAFEYFKAQNTDLAVLETGLGGRLDATNVARPLVAVITPISYEHTDKLGNTLSQIASEKAGIIKKGIGIVISAPQAREAMEVIRNRCVSFGIPLYVLGSTIPYAYKDGRLDVGAVFSDYKGLKVPLLGRHQAVNAAVAVSAVDSLKCFGITAAQRAVRQGLTRTVWPGRCEIVRRRPLVVLDGAQNRASFRALKDTVLSLFAGKKVFMILGVSKDKDIPGICTEAAGFADELILTKSSNPRAATPGALAAYFEKKKVLYQTESVKEAMRLAFTRAGKDDLILVCGSLFLVGEFRDEYL